MKILNKKLVYHNGELDITKKFKDSFEGSGISVSEHPKEWSQITRRHIRTNILVKGNAQFVDYYSLSAQELNDIRQWGIKNNLLLNQNVFVYEYYDDDLDMEVSQTFISLSEAEEEGYEESDLIPKLDIVGSQKLLDLAFMNGDLIGNFALEITSTIYFEQLSDYDGIWWNDTLDVDNYSAPRGVIFNSKFKDGWSHFASPLAYAIGTLMLSEFHQLHSDKNAVRRLYNLKRLNSTIRFKNTNIFVEKVAIQRDRYVEHKFLVVGLNSIAICNLYGVNFYDTSKYTYTELINILKKNNSKDIHNYIDIQKLK